jgi:hypothetical protein
LNSISSANTLSCMNVYDYESLFWVMAKVEEGISTLEEKDIVIIASVVARMYTNLKRIRMNYCSPKEFGEKGPPQLHHTDLLLAFSFLYNIHKFDTNGFYKPEDMRKIIREQMYSRKDEDSTNVQNSLPCDAPPDTVYYRDMNRAIQEIAKVIDLKKVKKGEIHRIAREQHISFSGMPSLYQVRDEDENLKTLQYIHTKPLLINFIIKTLRNMNFVDDFAFFVEGFIYWMRNDPQEGNNRIILKVFDVVLNSNPFPFDIEIEKEFQLLRNYLLSIDETKVNTAATRIVSQVLKIPQICWPFLLLSLLSI